MRTNFTSLPSLIIVAVPPLATLLDCYPTTPYSTQSSSFALPCLAGPELSCLSRPLCVDGRRLRQLLARWSSRVPHSAALRSAWYIRLGAPLYDATTLLRVYYYSSTTAVQLRTCRPNSCGSIHLACSCVQTIITLRRTKLVLVAWSAAGPSRAHQRPATF